MASKTISIDLEAYGRLKRVQKANESFSQTIKRVIGSPVDLDRLLSATAKNPLSERAVHAIETVITARRPPAKKRPAAKKSVRKAR